MTEDPNNPEILVRVATEAEAVPIITALADRGIEASTTGDFTAGFRAEAPGLVNVVVRSVDLESAKSALAEIKREQGHIDWSNVDVGEPEDE